MLLKRFGFYFIGFSAGLIFLAFFFNGKRTSCSYGPEARVIKNITSKKVIFSNDAKAFLLKENIDTTTIKNALKVGDVKFDKSDPQKKPCGYYYIQLNINNKNIASVIENCEKQANVESIYGVAE